MRIAPFLLLALLTGGCADYTAAQMQLTEQARRGIALTSESIAGKSQLIEQLHALQRRRMDEAFDADVRETGDLSAQWVIEHRRAYAAGLDALATQPEASRQAAETDQRNLSAARQALEQLLWLQSLQLRWSFPLPKETP
jgi:hypothetical protein